MAAEAIAYRTGDSTTRILSAAAAVASGEIQQLPSGRAGVFTAQNAAASGDVVAFADEGKFTVLKTTSQVWIKGDPIWWDHSANTATCNEPIGAGDRDFYLGVACEDATSAATTGIVDLNKPVSWIIDSTRDVFDFNIIKTVVGSTTVEVPLIFNRAGCTFMQFGTTAEAQTVSMISDRSFAVGSNWICEILLQLDTAADNAAVDIDVGVASAAGTTDFEAVAEFAAFHLDGDDLNIDAHSDDGTTDKAPTDTTIDIVAGTPIRLKLDGRDLTDVKYYINGAEVLSAEANLGAISAAAGPLKAIVMAEKTSDDSPLGLQARIRVRTMQQD